MKCIGMLGGMSWESTASYYRLLNQGVGTALGGLHSARVLLYSVDFAEIERLQVAGAWEAAGQLLTDAALTLERAGADCLLICTNTMHRVAQQVEEALTIPLLHIADATGRRLQQDGISRVALLGTRFTMEQPFYRERLSGRFGIEVLVPGMEERMEIHRIIYEELCLGQVLETSRRHYLAVIERLYAAGAEAVILGCTEIGLLVEQHHTAVPLYDTTALHAADAVTFATAGNVEA